MFMLNRKLLEFILIYFFSCIIKNGLERSKKEEIYLESYYIL